MAFKWYPSIKRIDNNEIKNIPNPDFWNQDFYLQEKIDGSNISLVKYQGKVIPFSRNQKIKMEDMKQFALFWEKYESFFNDILQEGEVVNGEWIEQGKIKYKLQPEDIPFVIFDYGQASPIYLTQCFDREHLTDEQQTYLQKTDAQNEPKIIFYPLSKLQSTFGNKGFKLPFLTNQPVKVEPVWKTNEYGYDYLADLLVHFNNQKLSYKTEIEDVLKQTVFKNGSVIFPNNNYEGIVIKSADGKLRLKNVFEHFIINKHKKSATPKEVKDAEFLQWVKQQVSERYEKFNDFIRFEPTLSDNQPNPFYNTTNIYQQVYDDKKLFSPLGKTLAWFTNDILSELPQQNHLTIKLDNKFYDFKDEKTKQLLDKYVRNFVNRYIVNKQFIDNQLDNQDTFNID